MRLANRHFANLIINIHCKVQRSHQKSALLRRVHPCIFRFRLPPCGATQEFKWGSDVTVTTPLLGANPVLSLGISEMP